MRRALLRRYRGGGGLGGVVAPVAGFVASGISGGVPLTTIFSDSSSNSPTAWAWDFGDGATSNAQNPSHTYTAAGTYTVSLTAANSAGSNTSTQTALVTANAPVAPGQVTGVAGTPSSNSVDLSWSAPSTGTLPFTYKVEQSPTGANTWTTFATGVTTLTATVTGLAVTTGYDFSVSATNTAGTGAMSATATVTTTGTGSGTALLTWPQRVDSAGVPITTDNFKIYWGTTSGGPYTNNVSIPNASLATTTSWNGQVEYTYTVGSLTSGTWYFVIVTVDGSGNESNASPEISKVI